MLESSLMGEPKVKDQNASEIEAFLNALFEGQEGYVYTPTKADDGEWITHFTKWPENRLKAVTWLFNESQTKDTYVAPSLFKAPSDKKAAWKGSNYVWIEFDGNAPKPADLPDGIPEPTIRVQSSVAGHEHWYWKLDSFETNRRVIEGLAKQLTYTLEADKSGWDCSQVLRAPGTVHQESRRRVKLIENQNTVYSFGDFKYLVTPLEPAKVHTNSSATVDIQKVISKYRWETDTYDLFCKTTIEVGSRSSAMTRLCFDCIEMGMTNDECYVLLYDADERWGKYKNRNPADRSKRLIGIISHCRGQKELDAELSIPNSDAIALVTLREFLSYVEDKPKWVFKDFLPEQGLGFISSKPGSGKSTLSFLLGFSVVLAKDFLIWKSAMEIGKKVGFFSLEMRRRECMMFVNGMLPGFAHDEQEIIKDKFHLYSLKGQSLLTNKLAQQQVLDTIDNYGIEFVIIDSLKAATGLDENKLDGFFSWLGEHVIENRGCTVWMVHHNRKASAEGSKKPEHLDDVYGDMFITAYPTNVITLWKKTVTSKTMEVITLKNRLAEESESFVIERTKHRNFNVTTKAAQKEEAEQENKEADRAFSGNTTKQ